MCFTPIITFKFHFIFPNLRKDEETDSEKLIPCLPANKWDIGTEVQVSLSNPRAGLSRKIHVAVYT